MQKLLILGTGNFALEIADIVSEIPEFELAGFVENMDRQKCNETIETASILWVEDINKFKDNYQALCALGSTRRNLFIEQVTAYGFRFATLVHSSAIISKRSSLEWGTIIGIGVIIASHSTIGKHVIVNRGATIGHHTEICDYTTIGPGANIAGSCCIKKSVYIGIGAVVSDHITIGSNSVIGAGAVVIEDVPDNVLVVGVPARIIKRDIKGK